MPILTPEQAMLMAIEEGKKGAGFVSPNPLVGCVILSRYGEVIASGYHAVVGQDHAEAAALKKVVDPKSLEGAKVYVTLEPCAHQGRTPSCAKTLAALPIASVTFGLEDPNPLVSGKGAAILREAGKSVEIFSKLKPEFEELAEIFLLNQRQKRPFVAVKIASSLDGKIALPDGTSQWITGPDAREKANWLRGNYDAVLTGTGTLFKDNPKMNSRVPQFVSKRQRLVILDPSGKSLSKLHEMNALQVRVRKDVIVVTKTGCGGDIEAPFADGEFDLETVIKALETHGIHSLFVEGGAVTTAAFIKSGLMDRLYLFLAPKVLGEGISWTSGLNIESLDKAFGLDTPRVMNVGPDLFITARKHS